MLEKMVGGFERIHGSYQDQLQTLFLVGGFGWESTHLAFGMLFHCV